MKIGRIKDKVLLEQEEFLTNRNKNPNEWVVFFPNREKLLIVLQNVLDGKFVELLINNKVYDYYVDTILNKPLIAPVSMHIWDLIYGAFVWKNTKQGSLFWGNLDNALHVLIRNYENKEKV